MKSNSDIILKTEELCKYYGTGDNLVKAVDHINLQIQQGEFITIVGKSGSGKSTLLHTLGALDNPTSGKVWIDGENIAAFKEEKLSKIRRQKIGFIFQAYNLIPSLNVWENIVLPLGLDGKPLDESFIKDIIETLGLTDKMKNLPNTLSGGQQQRCAIARAIAAKPSIILADEPTGNLDTQTGDEVITLLKTSAKKYGQTLVVITHNEEIAQMADRTILLADGKIVSMEKGKVNSDEKK
ncbi:MAG: ABC transporter ATP-binding protein [Lachnospiraceae bacterium]|nr:ABC transporter ATP-binding protein [Lachnospiraceae bacterium]